jgi:hypothetical protein
VAALHSIRVAKNVESWVHQIGVSVAATLVTLDARQVAVILTADTSKQKENI